MFIIEWIGIRSPGSSSPGTRFCLPCSGAASGITWALSIVGLVVVIRILLIPLFVKQIKAQRNMQLIQPKMKEIQRSMPGTRAPVPGDDEALQGDRHEPAVVVSAHHLAGADLLRSVPGLAVRHRSEKPVGALTPELTSRRTPHHSWACPVRHVQQCRRTPNPRPRTS